MTINIFTRQHFQVWKDDHSSQPSSALSPSAPAATPEWAVFILPDSPLLRTLTPPPRSRPQHRFLGQSGGCFLLSAPSLSLFSPLPTLPREAASENANLMISWQLKIFCHFPSSIKFQVLRRSDNVLRLPFATSPFFLQPSVLLAFLQSGPPYMLLLLSRMFLPSVSHSVMLQPPLPPRQG